MELEAPLRAFAAVARRRSFSAAAEELSISQPAVSRHVALLERRLGVKLVERAPRRQLLTPAGEFLSGHVLRAEALLAQASVGLAAYADPGSGLVVLAASGVPGTYLLPPVLAGFYSDHPGVQVQVLLSTSAGAVELVRTHKAELAIVGGFVAALELEAEHLCEDDIVLVGPGSLSDARLSRNELNSSVWVLREEGSATRATVESAWKNLGITPAKVVELPSWEAVKLTVASGGGLAPCSGFAIEREVRSGDLCVLDAPNWKVRRSISMVYSRDAALTPPARLLADSVRERWGRQPTGDERHAESGDAGKAAG
ncbi:MAG TPA: LysR family transcriptional regulator [Dehalococcoidia bacterium]|nr:LysR family transcriptional regulator [Dehalococcoidia bacterium]